VLNSVFKAERLKESEPEKALELIDQTIAKVESAELSSEAAAPLVKQLNRTRTVLRTEIEQQAPNIELRAENKRVKDQIEKEIKAAVRIDQDMVKLVEEYNDLYKQQRYAEAVVVAKKAKELNPKDPSVVVMVIKGRQDIIPFLIIDFVEVGGEGVNGTALVGGLSSMDR
jgi:superfamily II RNA helicase